MVEHALNELLSEGGLADLTQHDLQTYLWFTLSEADEPQRVASALAAFLELAEMNRYASVAASAQTAEILRTYEERGHQAGTRAGTRAMDTSGILPPDLPELEWGEIMGTEEIQAYERIAATLELALAAGELKPGGRGWRATQVRLARQQLTMNRNDGPPLLDRINTERLEIWAESGGPARRALAASIARRSGSGRGSTPGRGRSDGADAVAARAGRWSCRRQPGRAIDRRRQPVAQDRPGGGRTVRLVGLPRPATPDRVRHLAAARAA